MNLDLSALGLLGVAGLVSLGIKLLLNRMDKIETTLSRHGNKLLRIEFKLGIPDNGNGDPNNG